MNLDNGMTDLIAGLDQLMLLYGLNDPYQERRTSNILYVSLEILLSDLALLIEARGLKYGQRQQKMELT